MNSSALVSRDLGLEITTLVRGRTKVPIGARVTETFTARAHLPNLKLQPF